MRGRERLDQSRGPRPGKSSKSRTDTVLNLGEVDLEALDAGCDLLQSRHADLGCASDVGCVNIAGFPVSYKAFSTSDMQTHARKASESLQRRSPAAGSRISSGRSRFHSRRQKPTDGRRGKRVLRERPRREAAQIYSVKRVLEQGLTGHEAMDGKSGTHVFNVASKKEDTESTC